MSDKSKRTMKVSSVPIKRDTRHRFEQWAKNPSCEANTVSAVHNMPMYEVAKKESPSAKNMRKASPFALARGVTFERMLFDKSAKMIVEHLNKVNLLDVESPNTFIDLRTKMNGGSIENLDIAVNKFTELLQHLTAYSDSDQLIVAAATMKLVGNYMIPETILVVDALVCKRVGDRWELTVGEVKTYPDRGGFTDKSHLSSTRAQAGVYVYALDRTINELGLGSKMAVAENGFIVLTRPGTIFPRIRYPEDLKYQSDRAKRGFKDLMAVAENLKRARDDKKAAYIESAGTCYGQGCISFCERANICYEREFKNGNPVVLGDDVEEFARGINLKRINKIVKGQVSRTALDDNEKSFLDDYKGMLSLLED